MKKYFIIIFLVVTIFIVSIYNLIKEKNFDYFDLSNKNFSNKYLKEKEICLNFIEEKMISKKGGIFTNYLKSDKTKEYATGHEVLSESEGLIMLFYVKNNNKRKFDEHFEFLMKYMLLKEGLFKWRISDSNIQLSNSSASIDDLRIVRALAYAYNQWEDKKYLELLKKINRGLLKYTVYNGILTDYYDNNSANSSQLISLSYIDLYTIDLLSKKNKEWESIYNNCLEVLENGYISDNFPHYKKSFNISEQDYLAQDKVNIIDSLLVILHLSEVNLVKRESIDWIRNQVYFNNGLFNEYDINTGKPTIIEESTAAYAIAARIAKNVGDENLYNELIKKMLRFQITNSNSDLYGAFGDIETLKVYSFDNLQAILAL